MKNLIVQYFDEKRKWIKFGKPIRSQSEKDRIYRICQSCEFFKERNSVCGSCTICGCNIKRYGNFLNKIAWGTTRCPLEKARWTEDKQEYTQDINETEKIIDQDNINNKTILTCCSGKNK